MSAATPNPILFPFTTLAGQTLDAISSDLGRPVVLYQPSLLDIDPELQSRADSGQLMLRCPVSGDEERIAGLLRHFRHWAEEHAGHDLTMLAAAAPAVPFFEETSPSALRRLIRDGGRAQCQVPAAAPPAADRLTPARVLLQLAQQYDRQQCEVAQQLARSRQHESHLMYHLLGSEPELKPVPAAEPIADPSLGREPAVAAQRLKAWCQLLLQDVRQGRDERQLSQLLTTHAEIFDAAIEALPRQWCAQRGDGGDCFLAAGKAAASLGRLRCVHLPGICPSRILSCLLRHDLPSEAAERWDGETVLGVWLPPGAAPHESKF